MANGETGKLDGEYNVNTHRSHLAAYVLIAGLIFELIASVIWFKGTETLFGMFAVFLIVAGVWGEVFFGNKARIAGDRQLAEYESRTAEANQKAREAQRDTSLSHIRAERISYATDWRSPWSNFEDAIKLRDALSKEPGTVVISFVYPDRETRNFAMQFGGIFQNAHWKVFLEAREYVLKDVTGFRIPDSDDQKTTEFIRSAFKEAGFGFVEYPIPSSEIVRYEAPNGLAVIMIGQKPTPPPPEDWAKYREEARLAARAEAGGADKHK